MFTRKFVHLTTDFASLESILTHGLLITPRRRNVWKYFIRRKEFRHREPEQFGMTCVHAYRLSPDRRCLDRFGRYGIGFTEDWIKRSRFRRVMYLSENGIVRQLLQPGFDRSLEDLDERVAKAPQDDAFPLMSYTNRNVAALHGAESYAEFLYLFRYMEPRKHKYQSEWRYARDEPYYNFDTADELARQLKSDKGWAKHVSVLKFEFSDVTSILCPAKDLERTRSLVAGRVHDIAYVQT